MTTLKWKGAFTTSTWRAEFVYYSRVLVYLSVVCESAVTTTVATEVVAVAWARDSEGVRVCAQFVTCFFEPRPCCARHDVALKSYLNNINPDVGHRIAPMWLSCFWRGERPGRRQFVDTEESFKRVWSFRGRIHGTMNLDSLSFTLSQISYLVANLSKRNFRESCQEISVVSIGKHLGGGQWKIRSLLHYFITIRTTSLPSPPAWSFLSPPLGVRCAFSACPLRVAYPRSPHNMLI